MTANPKNSIWRTFLYVLVAALTAAGCGIYSFTGHGIAGIESIAVESFSNQTEEFGIAQQLTDEVVSKLLQDRTFKISDRSSADAILTGSLNSISDSPLTYTEDQQVSEYSVKLMVAFELRKPDQSEPVWKGNLTGSGNYPFESGMPEEREEGLKTAFDQITTDLLNQLTSDW